MTRALPLWSFSLWIADKRKNGIKASDQCRYDVMRCEIRGMFLAPHVLDECFADELLFRVTVEAARERPYPHTSAAAYVYWSNVRK